MLPSQVIDIPFGVGIDEKVRREILDPGTSVLSLTNLRIDKTGSYHKRHGYQALEPLPGEGLKLGQLNGVPYAINGEKLYNYSGQLGFVPLGNVSPCEGSRRPLLDFSSNQSLVGARPEAQPNYEIGYANNVMVVVTQAQIIAYDTRNGSVLIKEHRAVNNMVRCVTVGNVIIIVNAFPDPTGFSTNIDRIYLDTTNLGAGFQGYGDPPLVTDALLYYPGVQKMGFFDVCRVDSTHYALVYPRDFSGAFDIGLATFTATATTPSAATTRFFAGLHDIISVGVGCRVGDVMWIAVAGRNDIGGNNTMAALTVNPTTLALVSAVNPNVLDNSTYGDQLNIGVVPTTTQHAIVIASNPYSDQRTVTGYIRLDGSGATVIPEAGTGGQTNIWRYALRGKPFEMNSRFYAPLLARVSLGPTSGPDVLYPELESTIQLTDITDVVTIGTGIAQAPKPVCTIAPRLSSNGGTPLLAASTVRIGNTWSTLITTQQTGISSAIELAEFDFAASNRWQNDELSNESSISGGIPASFDAQTVTELSFTRYPEYLHVFPAGTGTGLTGVFSYVAIYEWTTNSGEIVRSAPCPISSSNQVSLSNQVATVQIPTLQLTLKDLFGGEERFVNIAQQVRIVVYRTEAAGTIYYRLDSFRNQSSASIGVDVFQFNDSTSDSDLRVNEPLYRQPGTPGTALAKVCPPASSCMVIHRNRLWFVGDDGITVWYSGQFVDGEQSWFSDAFTVQVPKGGPITALASMDGILYIFKRDFIFSVTGDGPADNGSGNDLSTPEEMDVEIGCIEPRSVVVAPGGIFFQSARGMWMLTRSRSVAYAGKQIEETLRMYPAIVSAAVSDTTGCILWEALTGESESTGITIVFDYVHGQWMIDQKTDSETESDIGAHGGVVIAGTYYWVSLNGLFNRELSTYLDYGNFYSGIIETAWMKLAGLQGFQRCRTVVVLPSIVGNDVDISISAYRDYDETNPFGTATWTSSEIINFTTPKPQLSYSLPIQKMESLKLVIRDDERTGEGQTTGEGPTWVGLALEVGVKVGTDKLPAANTK